MKNSKLITGLIFLAFAILVFLVVTDQVESPSDSSATIDVQLPE